MPSTPLVESIETVKVSSKVPSQQSFQSNQQTLATPAVRRLIKENKLDIASINGTGKDNRILKDDVLNHLSKPMQSSSKTILTPSESVPTANEIIPLSPMQKAMLTQMTKSISIPHFGYSDEIDVSGLLHLRKQINASLKNKNIKKITLMSIFIKGIHLNI